MNPKVMIPTIKSVNPVNKNKNVASPGSVILRPSKNILMTIRKLGSVIGCQEINVIITRPNKVKIIPISPTIPKKKRTITPPTVR